MKEHASNKHKMGLTRLTRCWMYSIKLGLSMNMLAMYTKGKACKPVRGMGTSTTTSVYRRLQL